ncbi:hypothetical protein [Enterococcus larvae]|uniref:hypothetical protein n=1 Tax=Enterococcus larvae TaxID=2794352 RepID=UPI003F2CA0CB
MGIQQNRQYSAAIDLKRRETANVFGVPVNQRLLLTYTIDNFHGTAVFSLDGIGKIGIWSPKSRSGILLSFIIEKGFFQIENLPSEVTILGISWIS